MPFNEGSKKDISISILQGLSYKWFNMGYLSPMFCLCAFFGGPYSIFVAPLSGAPA